MNKWVGGLASVHAFSKSFTELSAFCRCSDSFAKQCVHSAVDCFSSVMLARHPTQLSRTAGYQRQVAL